MRFQRYQRGAIVAAIVFLASLPAAATTVMQMNLADLVGRADRIVRGTVVAATEGTIDVGGTSLPVVTYRVQVDEVFRGEVSTVKGVRIAEIKMLGKTSARRAGGLQRVSVLPEMPQLLIGQDYLLFTTQPSAVGLSTTVGLGQGSFAISQVGKDEVAINGAKNSGLYRGMSTGAPLADGGAVVYDDLARQVRVLVASRGGRQ
jgi:hypothetical protein